jgi:hypothetical protein
MEKYKGFIHFALICLYILGTIGGIGYACYNHAYLIAVGVAAVALMAFPYIKVVFKKMAE